MGVFFPSQLTPPPPHAPTLSSHCPDSRWDVGSVDSCWARPFTLSLGAAGSSSSPSIKVIRSTDCPRNDRPSTARPRTHPHRGRSRTPKRPSDRFRSQVVDRAGRSEGALGLGESPQPFRARRQLGGGEEAEPSFLPCLLSLPHHTAGDARGRSARAWQPVGAEAVLSTLFFCDCGRGGVELLAAHPSPCGPLACIIGTSVLFFAQGRAWVCRAAHAPGGGKPWSSSDCACGDQLLLVLNLGVLAAPPF